MFSHKPIAHCQHTCCQRNCLACLGPSVVQVIVSSCCRFCRRCRTSTMSWRIVDAHCCRICQRPCTMPLLMHAAIPASSVYVKSRTAYCPDLSSAPTAEFLDAADLTNAAEFPLSHCVIPAVFRQALGNPRPSPNSRQHTAALVIVCCRTHTLSIFTTVTRAATP